MAGEEALRIALIGAGFQHRVADEIRIKGVLGEKRRLEREQAE